MFNNITYSNNAPLATTVPVQGASQYGQAVGYQGSQIPYGNDQAQFGNINSGIPVGQPVTAPPSQIEVGFMDKMKSYFNDVYRSEDNLRAYKFFQEQADSNPAYLKPGSTNRQRVLDLQQQLNIVGIKANINGIYGYATGEAVKEFKRSVGLNDGYLDKEGRPAITDVATPQMFNVLTSMVNKKLNPNTPGPANPMPVTQEDLLWVQNLYNRVQQFGYQPTKQEYDRYNDVMQRYQSNNGGATPPMAHPLPPYQPYPNPPVTGQPQYPVPQPVVPQPSPYQPYPNPPVQPQQSPPLTQGELDWAFQLQDRILNQNYQPTPQESQQYEDIFSRYQQLQQQPTAPVQPQQPASAPTGAVSQQELQWAMDLQQRIETQGYRPTQQEFQQYTDIYNRYQNQPQNPGSVPPSPPRQPGVHPPVLEEPQSSPPVQTQMVSQEELQWALNLQERIVNQNYQPTQQEVLRYTDIFNRYQNQQAAPEPQPTPPEPQPPTQQEGATQQEVQWAQQLEGRIVQGYQPTADEVTRYNNIQMKMAIGGIIPGSTPQTPSTPQITPTAPSTTGSVTQQDIDWALNLQQRVQMGGYQPTQDEISRYTDIYNRYQQQMQGASTTPAPAPQVPQTSGNVSDADIQWALQLEQRVQTQNYEPTQQEIARYQDIAQRIQAAQSQQQPVPQPATQPQPTYQPQPVAPTGAPTQEELQWATQLMAMVQQNGYQPNDQEMARYTDIYNRMQQSQGAPTSQPTYQPQPQQTQPPGMIQIDISAADPELQWALELLNRFRQGYQPTPQEIQLYERIIARKAVPQATP